MKRLIRPLALLLALVLVLSACEPLGEKLPDGSGLTVYFIDVGQGDSELIVCDGAAMLIDGGGAAESSVIYAFLKNLGINRLDYIVATHAHEDHVGGLSGALNYAEADIALCPVTEFDSAAFESFVKYLDKQGKQITVPSPGDSFALGSARFVIVGPVRPAHEPNNMSLVIKLTYGDVSFLFTGDAERQEEADILASGYDISATVLKTGHHGSDTSTTYPFLRAINPQYAVISCGRKNSYGHPNEATLSRLRDADVTLYRTDTQGTITAKSDGKTVSFETLRNSDAQTNPTDREKPEEYYVGNVNSKKFHRPNCSGLPLEKNQIIFGTRQDAVDAGYSPCGTCKP